LSISEIWLSLSGLAALSEATNCLMSARTAVRALIRQFIAAEDVKKPLSDSALAAMLEEQGIQCARRTVAKYREGMKIPTAPLRKAP
jgi:RNA polymerase sigma-54 factor